MTPMPERYRIAIFGWLATVATSLSFWPALDDKSYFLQGAFYAGCVVALGLILRALRTPTIAVVLIQFVALLELLLLQFGTHLKWGFIPTGATISGLQDLIRTGADIAQKYAAPAPRSQGLLLMVLFAIALVALLVDLFAVSLSRVSLAGLPLLALYTIPVAALPHGVPFYAFVPGAAAFIAMLMSDERERLSHWGRLVSRSERAADPARLDTSGLNATGRRVSVLALSAAVVLPIFVPALSSSILDGGKDPGIGGRGGAGGGLSFSDPMVSLAESLQRKDPFDLMKITSKELPDYLRLVVLDTPGPNDWRATSVNLDKVLSLRTVLPHPPGISDSVLTQRSQMQITLTEDFPNDSAWLPVPYFPENLSNLQEDFGYVPADQTVAARNDGAFDDLETYDVSYSFIDPTADQLRAAGTPPPDIVERYTDVPQGVPSEVATLAESVTRGALSHYDQAVLLQNFFREKGEFTYDLDAGYGYGYGAMAEFLNKRHGFCQHFAATMAMMARTLGIPSRVAVGFLEPDGKNGDGQYIITSHNVHAWPELYFEGVGWVRFEPTPGVSAPYPSYAQATGGVTSTENTPTSNLPTGGQESLLPERPTTSVDAGGAGSTSDGPSGPAALLPSTAWLIVIGVVLLAFLPAGLRLAVRRARLTHPIDLAAAAESAWIEVCDHVRDLRLPWAGSMTPRARERSVAPFLNGDRDGLTALNRLALSVERARYATTALPEAAPAADAREVMSVISREADRGQRVRAFFWPSSLMPDIRRGWERVMLRLRRSSGERDQ